MNVFEEIKQNAAEDKTRRDAEAKRSRRVEVLKAVLLFLCLGIFATCIVGVVTTAIQNKQSALLPAYFAGVVVSALVFYVLLAWLRDEL